MTTTIEYALLAGDAYYDTRDAINRFPTPSGWEMVSRFPQSESGFEASAYSNGTEVVISYAGTYPTDFVGDWVANSTLASGVPGEDQLLPQTKGVSITILSKPSCHAAHALN